MKLRKIISIALALVTLLSMTAIFAGCGKKTTESISVCLASEPDTIDPALNSAVDGATLIIHAFSGIAAYKQTSSGKLEIYADSAKELVKGVVGEDGKVTYTYTLRDGLKWSDGTDLVAGDFVYAWNRAVNPETAADYSYMFDVIDGFEAASEGKGTLNVTAPDDKTLVVVLNNEVPYFEELLAFPTYMPVKQSVVEADPDGWATDPSTYICNGPYTMTQWEHDSKIVYTKNPNYHAAKDITVNEIVFYLSDDANNMLANFKNGTWLFIDDVPTAEISTLSKDYPNEYVTSGQLGTYYVIFNVNKDLLPSTSTLTGADKEAAEAEVRNALSLLIDRNYVCVAIGQAGQKPASSYVAMGLTDADGKTEFYQNAGDKATNGYAGYYDVSEGAFTGNTAKAIDILKKYYAYDDATKKFTDFPTMNYLYNTSEGHKAIGQYIQQAFAAYGITMTLENQEWNTFLNTRKDGNYTIARNGWLADYNDPISFLDMWLTASGNNDAQLGRETHGQYKGYSVDLTSLGIDYKVTNGTWAETYDYVINLVKKSTDKNTRYALMHIAEDLLMSTGAICPIYYYTDIYMCSAKLEGVFTSPLGYNYFMYANVK